jgi:hypothetical protein
MQLRLFRHFVTISVLPRVSSDALLITVACYRFPSESQVGPPIVFGASSFDAQLAARLSAAAVAAMVSVGLCSRVWRWQGRGRYSRQCQGLQHSHRSGSFQIRSDPPRPQRNRRIAAANSGGHLLPSPWSPAFDRHHRRGSGDERGFYPGRTLYAFPLDKSGGYGIGAFQTHELIRTAGGELGSNLRKRFGTTMRIILPLALEREPAASSARS